MPVYLDHNASTPLDPDVLEAMLPFLGGGRHGNPSSGHAYGRAAREAVERARGQVAALVGAPPEAVVFTGSGTEANNLALWGVTERLATGSPGRGVSGKVVGEIAVSAIEHPSVIGPARALARRGWRVRTLPVDAEGRVRVETLGVALAGETRLVSVMLANNETGVLQDIAGLGRLVRAHGALLHTDAVQAVGKVAVDFAASGAHLMSVSAHKIQGPQGVGALVVDPGLDLAPLIRGGGQERDRRSGTENVAGIVGFGAAAAKARRELAARGAYLGGLRERLEARLRAVPGIGIEIFSARADRLPNTSSFAVPGIDGATLLMMLDQEGFAVSSGSACASGSTEPSHVLLAMGVAPELARCALRVSLGMDNTPEQVDAFVDCLAKRVGALRALVMRETA